MVLTVKNFSRCFKVVYGRPQHFVMYEINKMRRLIRIYEYILCNSCVYFTETFFFRVFTQLAALCSKQFYLKSKGVIYITVLKLT